jgi:excisionase family DNA binding protein
MDSNEKALSVKEVAAGLGCSRDTVRRGIEGGKIRAF